MSIKKYIYTFLLLLLLPLFEAAAILPEKQDSKWVNTLNGEWKFKFEKGESQISPEAIFNGEISPFSWENIKVPSNWEMAGFGKLKYKIPNKDEIGWYYREFEVPENWKKTDRDIYLYFEGVAFGFEVWVNGKRVGDFESAFNRAQFDIHTFIKKNEKNTILVKVYSNHEHVAFDASDSWSLNGIFRDVYLYAAPLVHFENVVITTPINKNEAKINIKTDIYSFDNDGKPLNGIELEAILKYNGELVAKSIKAVVWQGKFYMPKPINLSFELKNPKLWNAETPNLYELELRLKRTEEVYHNITRKVGIRKISIENSQLLLNGSPIKLRGVNLHEMHPERGRAVSLEDMKKDLELMKQANINGIRCSHYPPHPKFIELCDEYGFYVINEVPICFDEYAQRIPGNLGAMLERTNHTITRDINHASIIIWSVGNENPICTNWIKCYEYCKMLDSTRPALYAANNFGKSSSYFGMPLATDIFADHYPNTNEIREHRDDKNITAPIIYTEYNHALDKALYDLEERWNIMQNSPKHAGGFIWDWVDQELLRTVPKGAKIIDTKGKENPYPLDEDAYIANQWKNDSTILDCHAAYGNDGIVDGYRNPSVSYFEVQAVYSPVKIIEKKINLEINESPNITVQNHYDFIDLKKHQCTWKWYSNNKLQKEGELQLNAMSHTKQELHIPFTFKKSLANKINVIEISVFDHEKRNILIKTIQILTKTDIVDINKNEVDNKPKFKTIPTGSEIKIGTNQKLVVDKNGKFKFLLDSQVVAEGPILKTGRRADNTIKWLTYYNKKKKRKALPKFYLDIISENYRLKDAKWFKNEFEIKLKLLYAFTLKDIKERVLLHLDMTINESGNIDFEYQIDENTTEIKFLELGFGLKIPNLLENIAWIGDGPYPQYPRKESSGNYNYHKMKITNSNFEGNHTNISAILATNTIKSGIGILSNNENWAFNTDQDSYILSNMIFVGDRPKKGAVPSLISLDKAYKNNFSFFLFKKGKITKQLKGLL